MRGLYKANSEDNVATALMDLKKGETYPLFEVDRGEIGSLTVVRDIPQYAKVSLSELNPENNTRLVIKFGYPIAQVSVPVPAGMLLHISSFAFDVRAADLYVTIPFGILGTAKVDLKQVVHVGDIEMALAMKSYLEGSFDLSNPRTILGETLGHNPQRGSDIHVGNLFALPEKNRGNKVESIITAYYNLMKSQLFLDQLKKKGGKQK